MLYIEDILAIEKKMSKYQLIYKMYNFKWGFTILMTFFIGCCTLFIALFFSARYLWFIIPGASLVIFSIAYDKGKTKIIIENYYPYAIDATKCGHSDYMYLIKKREFEKLLDERIILNGDKILFLIEALKRENDSKKYNFLFPISILTILSSAFLSPYLNELIGQGTDLEHRLRILHGMGAIVLLFVMLAFFFDKAFIRDSVITIRSRNNRIIRILENIYLEKYAGYRK